MRYSLYPAFWVFILFAAFTASGQGIQLSFTSVPPSCNGYTNGSVTVNPTGGALPYTYLWNTGQTGQTNVSAGAGVYTVTVTAQGGLTASGSTTLGQPTALTASIGASGFNCGENGTLTGLAGNGVAPYSFHWSTGSNMASISVSTFGIYYLTVTDANGCIAIANKYVAPTLVADLDINNILCASLPNGGSAQVGVAGGVAPYTYLWSTGAVTQDVQGLSQGGVTVTVTDANGCIAVEHGIVTQPTQLLPTVTIIAPACGGNTGSATVSAVGGTPPYTIKWMSLGLEGPTQNNLAPGTYYVCVFDANGCQKDIHVVIPDAPGLSINLVLTKAECPGVDVGTATALVTPPGNYNYTWNVQPGNNTPQVTGLAANTVVSVTVTDPVTGCIGTATGVIGMHNQVQVAVTDVDVACVGDSTGSATAVASSGTMPYTYVWTFPDSSTVTGPQITGLTVGAYLVVVTDLKGCTAAGVADITGAAGPTAGFSVEPLNCVGDSIKMLFSNQSVDPVNIVSWHWVITRSDGSQIQFNQQNPPVLTLPYLETGTVQLTVTSANGCTDVATGPFQATGTPVVNVTLTTPGFTCDNLPVPITVSGDPNYTYSWSPLTGLTPALPPPSVIADPDTTTTYVLTVVNGLCSDTFMVQVVRHDLLELHVASDTIVTCDSTATLSATVFVPLQSIVWYNAAGTSVGNTTTIVVPAGAATFYTVVATDVFGCTKTDTVTVMGQDLEVLLNISGPTFSCDNLPVPITVTGAAGNTYTWIQAPGLTLVNLDGTSVVVDPAVTTVYILVAQNTAGCTDSIPVEIIRHDSLWVDAGPDSLFTCDSLATLTATVSATNATIKWYGSNQAQIGNTSTITVAAGPAATYIVVATDSLGCSASDTITVIGNDLDVTVTVDTAGVFCDNLPVPVTVTGAAGNTYSWIPATGLTMPDSTVTIWLADPDSTTIYQLVVQNGDCVDTVPVEIIRHIPINLSAGPDVFTCDSTATLTATVTTTANTTFVWYNASGVSLANAPVLVVSATGTATYIVIATDSFGCTETDTITVTGGTLNVNVSVDTTGSFCDNLPVLITVTGAAGNTYSWIPATGLTMPDSTVTIWLADPDSTTIYQLVVQNGDCVDTVPVEIIRHIPINLSAGPDVFTCDSTATLTATVTTTDSTTIVWYNASGVSLDTTPVLVVIAAGTNTYIVIATDSFGCTETDTITVTGGTLNVNVSVDTTGSFCDNLPVLITVTGAAGNTYSWIPATGLTMPDSTVTIWLADPDSTTIYQLVVQNGDCVDTVPVEIIPHIPINLSAGPDVFTCDSTATLTATVTTTDSTTIVWYNASGVSLDTTPVLVVIAAGTNTYIVIATDSFGCTETDTITVTGGTLNVNVSVDTTGSFCDNLPVLITVTGAAGNTYTWIPATGLTMPDSTVTIWLADPDSTTIYQLVVQNGDCVDTVPVEIIRHIPINLSAGPDVFTCDSTATLTATVTTTVNTTFIWYNVDGDSLTNTPVLVVSTDTTMRTFIVVATDSLGCTETDTVNVTGGALHVTVDIDTSGSICDNLPVHITVSGSPGYVYTWFPVTGLTFTPDSTNLLADPDSTTVYQLIVYNGDCVDTTLVEITRHIPLDLSAGPDIITCDSLATITATVDSLAHATFVWYDAHGDTVATTAVLTVAVHDTLTTYIVVVTDTLGCSVSDTISVSKGGVDVAVDLEALGNICDNPPIKITVTSASSGNVYYWFPLTDLQFNPDSANVIVDPPVTTIYQLVVQNGICIDTIPVEILRHEPINLLVNPDTVITCNPTAELSATVSVDSVTIEWVNSAGVTVGTGPTHTVSTATDETIIVIATDLFGCTDTQTVTVVAILANIAADASTPDSTCENIPFAVVINNLNPGDTLTYEWSGNGLVFTPPNLFSGPAGNYTVTVIATNQFTCADTLEIPVTLIPNEDFTGMINIDLCRGKSVRFENTSGIPGTWDFGDGNGSSLNPVTHLYATDDTYFISFTPDASVCADPFLDTIAVLPEPAVKATATSNYLDCGATALIQFTGNAVPLNPGLSWNWSFNAGSPNSSNQQNPTVLFGEEGTVTATLIVTDQNHCADTASIMVPVQVINESIMGDTSVCMGESVQLNAGPTGPNYVYKWTASPSDSTLVANDPSPVVTPTDTTTYTLLITNDLCSTTFTTTVTPLPAATLELDDHVVVACTDAPVTLHIKHTNASSFTWSNSPTFDPPLGTDSTLVVATTAAGGVFYIRASLGTECIAVDSIVLKNGIFDLSGNNDTICVGSNANFNLTTSPQGQQLTYEWAPALDPVPNPTPSPAVSTTYQVIATNELGCKDTASLHVHVREYVSVIAQVTGPDTLLLGDTTTLLATGSGATAISYAWTPSGGLSNPFGAETNATIEETTVFTVTASADDHCPDTAQVTVVFRDYICGEPFIFVPTAFTPNNDNNNDLFIVRGFEITSLRFIVWDRWGEIVYETADVQATGWDGTYLGKEATPDAYAWYLEVVCGNGGTYKAKGNVTLLK